jgi:hypothetical protein
VKPSERIPLAERHDFVILPFGSKVVSGAPELAARRVWRLTRDPHVANCSECGRAIEPGVESYVDCVSGHLMRHVECHRKAEGGTPKPVTP